MAEVQYRKPLDDNLPWEQRLANYAQNPSAGRDEYKRALEVFNGKNAAGDTAGANAAKTWMGQVNTAIGGAATQPNDDLKQKLQTYLDQSTKPATPFQYDANSDPAYQSQKRIIEQDTARDMNNARVESGAVGMRGGSLQTNQLAQASLRNQQRLQNEITPQLMQQAYQRYNDDRTHEQQQIQNQLGYINSLSGLNQQELDNQYRGEVLSDKQKQDRINLANYLTTTYGVQADPKMDSQFAYDQVKGLTPLAMQQFQAGREDSQFARGIQEAGVTGMYNNQPTLQKQGQEFNQGIQKQQVGIQQQNANTSAFSATSSANNAKDRLALDKSKLGEGNLSQLTNSLNQTFGSFNEDGKFQGVDSNKSAQLRQAIINMNLPDYQTDQLLASYGLPTN